MQTVCLGIYRASSGFGFAKSRGTGKVGLRVSPKLGLPFVWGQYWGRTSCGKLPYVTLKLRMLRLDSLQWGLVANCAEPLGEALEL